MHVLKLKIPPPLVALVVGVAMWFAAQAAPSCAFILPAHRVLAACVALVGVATSIIGVASFRRAGTSVNPMRPEKATSLVISGIYNLTRNPMYLGLLLVLLAWAVFLSNALAFIALPAFILYMNRFQIGPEETALASVFGPAFAAYKSRVRRWL
jgi:protein-S-isoprenylcysteine O-methyltransferase Ste14